MNIPAEPSIGYIAAVLFLIGLFLFISGLNIIKIEKITVSGGLKTWLIGLILMIVGVLLGTPNITNKHNQESTSLPNNSLSNDELADIANNVNEDPKELSKKYFNKTVSLKGTVSGYYSGDEYMVVWINSIVGCLSSPSNTKFKALKQGDVITISGVIHHIQNEPPKRKQIVLAHGCSLEKSYQ